MRRFHDKLFRQHGTSPRPHRWARSRQLLSLRESDCRSYRAVQSRKRRRGGAGRCAESPLPTDAVGVWFTDPPYYDAVPYAELSDFFFSWLKPPFLPIFCSMTGLTRRTDLRLRIASWSRTKRSISRVNVRTAHSSSRRWHVYFRRDGAFLRTMGLAALFLLTRQPKVGKHSCPGWSAAVGQSQLRGRFRPN